MHGMVPILSIIDGAQTAFSRSFFNLNFNSIAMFVSLLHLNCFPHSFASPTFKVWIASATTNNAITLIVHTYTPLFALLKGHALFIWFPPTHITE
jgi:hypothetical protein